MHDVSVEDDLEVDALIESYRRGQRLRVSAVQIGHQALDVLSQTLVDVVLLDLGLPGEDGLSILRELRARLLDDLTHLDPQRDVAFAAVVAEDA